MKFPKTFLLATAVVATTVLSLSIHVVLQEVLGIPYPQSYPHDGWPFVLDNLCQALGAIGMYSLVHEPLRRLSLPTRLLTTAVLLLAVQETLVRTPVMNAIVSSAWAYTLLSNLPALAMGLWLSVVAIVVVRARFETLGRKIIAVVAALLAVAGAQLAVPAFKAMATVLLPLVSQPKPEDLILPPYGMGVLIPAYVTFLEPVIACFVLAVLARRASPQRSTMQLVKFLVGLLLFKRLALAPFIYVFYSGLPAVTSMLSVGQFSFEFAALACLAWLFTGLVDRWAGRAGAHPAPLSDATACGNSRMN